MRTRHFQITDEAAAALKARELHAKDGPTRTRMQAVRLSGLGYPVADIHTITGLSRSRLLECCRAYQHDGIAALSDHRAGGNNARMTVREIYSLNSQQADLVVLSACETQIDDTGIVHGQLSVDSGNEPVGLTRAFFYAGTPNVVSTLWQVDDK